MCINTTQKKLTSLSKRYSTVVLNRSLPVVVICGIVGIILCSGGAQYVTLFILLLLLLVVVSLVLLLFTFCFALIDFLVHSFQFSYFEYILICSLF